jgi:hypothetical protein
VIYFVMLDSGAIKIGFTEQLQKRLWTLKSVYKSKVVLLATLPGDKGEEKEIQERFDHLRLGMTEQFNPGADLMNFIGRPELTPENLIRVKPQPKTGYKSYPRSQFLAAMCKPETKHQAQTLARIWGPVRAVPTSFVIEESIRRVYEQEMKRRMSRKDRRQNAGRINSSSTDSCRQLRWWLD